MLHHSPIDAISLLLLTSTSLIVYLAAICSLRSTAFKRGAQAIVVAGSFFIFLKFFLIVLSHGGEVSLLQILHHEAAPAAASVLLIALSLGQALQTLSAPHGRQPHHLLTKAAGGVLGLTTLGILFDSSHSATLGGYILVIDTAAVVVPMLPITAVSAYLRARIAHKSTERTPHGIIRNALSLSTLLVLLLVGSLVVTRYASTTFDTHELANSSTHNGLGLQQVSSGPSLSDLGFSVGILPLNGGSELPVRLPYVGHSQVGNPNLLQEIKLNFTATLGRTDIGHLVINAVGTLQPDGSFNLSKSLATLSFTLGHKVGHGTATYISSQAVRGRISFPHNLRYDFTMSINSGPSNEISGVFSLIHLDASDGDTDGTSLS